MADDTPPQDPFEMFRRLWGPLGIPLPGMAVPTFDPQEVEGKVGQKVTGSVRSIAPFGVFIDLGLDMAQLEAATPRSHLARWSHDAQFNSGFLNHVASSGGTLRLSGKLPTTTWDDPYRGPFAPLVPGVTFGPADDPAALRAAVTDETAAIIVEPIQGEGGYIVPEDGFLQGLRRICDEHGILLIADEVQTGFARTGAFFAIEHYGIEPDLITVAKSIAAGKFPHRGVVPQLGLAGGGARGRDAAQAPTVSGGAQGIAMRSPPWARSPRPWWWRSACPRTSSPNGSRTTASIEEASRRPISASRRAISSSGTVSGESCCSI